MHLEQCVHQELFRNNHYFYDFAPIVNNHHLYHLFFYQRLFYLHTSTTISPTITIPLPTLYSFQTHKDFLLLHFLCKPNLTRKPPSSSPHSQSKINLMNPQQEEIVKYFQEHMQEERRQAEGTSSSPTATLSSPVREVINMALDENHITRCPPHVTCNLPVDDLQVLKELRVDFNNFASNGMDTWPEVISQGWENYFARLHGPVYEKLVKEFWKQADYDNHHVVSHVLGKRIIITEETIVQLLGLLTWKD